MLIIKFWADDNYDDWGLDNYTVTNKNDLILYCPRKNSEGNMIEPQDFYDEMADSCKKYLESEDYQGIDILEENGDEENIITTLHSRYALEQISTYPNFFQVELKKKIVEGGSFPSGSGFIDLLVTYDEDNDTFSFMGGDADYDVLVANYPNVRLACGVFNDELSETSVTELRHPIYLYPYSYKENVDAIFDFISLQVDFEPLMRYTPTTYLCIVAKGISGEVNIVPQLIQETQGMTIDIHPMNPTDDNPHEYRVNSEDKKWLENFTQSIRIITTPSSGNEEVYLYAYTSPHTGAHFVSLENSNHKLYYYSDDGVLLDEERAN